MMSLLPMMMAMPLAAKNGESDPTRIIWIVVVIVVWVIASIAKSVKRQQEQRNRRASQIPVPPGVPPHLLRPVPPQFARQASQRRTSQAPPRRAPVVSPQQRYAENLRRMTKVAPVPRQAPPEVLIELPDSPLLSRPLGKMSAPAAAHSDASASARAVAKWLSPTTLRHQFILTEILRPPLALREDEEGR